MRSLICAALLLAAPAALADGHAPFTYEQFEASVPHFDLEDCPKDLAADKAFCRMSFHNDMVHVFMFSEEGELPMIGFKSYDEDAYTLELK